MIRFNAVLLLAILLVATAFKSDKNIIHPAVGEEAPNIELTNPEGEVVSLRSLRGKVVLIDFWASWCRTCRIENHSLRRAYNTYKDSSFTIGEGFEIYSVSLDNDSSIWQKAIKNDRLDWESHVSDLKKWDSPLVKLYNFRYLPNNLLIDKEGRIVAKGLFGQKLEETLATYLAD
jgi:peroxiredoxin